VSEAALARMLLEQVGLSAPPEPEPEPAPEPEPRLSGSEPQSQPEPPEPAPEPETRLSGSEPQSPPEPEPERQYFLEPEAVVIEAPMPEPSDLTVEAVAEPEPVLEPVIMRMEDSRGRGKWWSRNGNKTRVRELEKVLSDFEQRSRAIEADIMRVRATLRNLRDARS
jgi:hypothetical protein